MNTTKPIIELFLNNNTNRPLHCAEGGFVLLFLIVLRN